MTVELTTLEAHTAGEPLRIITGGWPELAGATMLERRAYARTHHDDLRRMLMLEPRGHADMYGALLTPPASEDGDLGVLFMHNAGWSTMCGHGIIALVAVGLEHGLFEPRDRQHIRIDSPAGRILARYDEQRHEVSFENVPSFVLHELEVEISAGRVRCTVAFGGAFYAYLDVGQIDGLGLGPADNGALVRYGREIKAAVSAALDIRHPTGEADLNFLYGAIFVGAPERSSSHSRNVCVFADGEVDRSPTGTGVSGRAAIHHARGELELGRWIEIESILGTSFGVRALRETKVGELSAIVPEVRGSAHATGRASYWLDPRDPLAKGFMLR